MSKLEFVENFFFPLIVGVLLLFSLLTVIFRKRCANKKIQKNYPPFKMCLRDTGLSLLAPLFFFPSALLCYYLSKHNYGFSYHAIAQYGSGYFIVSLFLITLVHDTYYYWMHRLLHTPWLFKKIHAVHHRSRNPTVLTFFAMHPLESALMAFSIPLCVVIFPVCDLAFNVAYAMYMAQAIYAHSGFEYFKTHTTSRYFTTSHSHNLHHQAVRCNYSYFYNIWDRCCGTLVSQVPSREEAKLGRVN